MGVFDTGIIIGQCDFCGNEGRVWKCEGCGKMFCVTCAGPASGEEEARYCQDCAGRYPLVPK